MPRPYPDSAKRENFRGGWDFQKAQVGYSRLIRADEEGTLAALKGLRADLIDPTLAEHNGRIVKLMGDGMLAD